MDSRQLTSFRKVAETRNITRAAVELGYSQSAITAQIKALESAVGTQLFERSRDGVRLTVSGERFLPYATRMLKLTEDARRALTSMSLGTLTIGASESITTYRLPEVVECIRHRHPHVRLSLRAFYEGTEKILRSLVRGEIDVALLHSAEAIKARTGETAFQARRLATDDPVLVVAAAHELAGGTAPTMESLAEVDLLVPQADCVYASAFQDEFDEIGQGTVRTLELGTIEGVKKAVTAGLGASVLPRVVVADLIRNDVVRELPWRPRTPLSTYVVWTKSQGDQTLLRSLIGVLEDVAGEWSDRAAQAS